MYMYPRLHVYLHVRMHKKVIQGFIEKFVQGGGGAQAENIEVHVSGGLGSICTQCMYMYDSAYYEYLGACSPTKVLVFRHYVVASDASFDLFCCLQYLLMTIQKFPRGGR